jgi:hypothetical protein
VPQEDSVLACCARQRCTEALTLTVERRHATTGTAWLRASSRKCRITLCPRKSVNRMSSCVPRGRPDSDAHAGEGVGNIAETIGANQYGVHFILLAMATLNNFFK